MPEPIVPTDHNSGRYRDAYSRINALVVVGESLADRHFRLLARAIPEDRDLLLRLAAMEGRHARAFVECGRQFGVRPDLPLARRLFAPLAELFLSCDRAGDRAGCLVIQGLVVECFAVAAYQAYLPVADAGARPITAAVLAEEDEHLDYAEQWLAARLGTVEESLDRACRRALPITLAILSGLSADLRAIGIDPADLVAGFSARFQQALEAIGLEARQARRLITAAALAPSPA